MPVGGAKQKRTQDQHVQGALQQFDSVRRFVRHGLGRYSTNKSSNRVEPLPRFWLALYYRTSASVKVQLRSKASHDITRIVQRSFHLLLKTVALKQGRAR